MTVILYWAIFKHNTAHIIIIINITDDAEESKLYTRTNAITSFEILTKKMNYKSSLSCELTC